jgi:hypothetical protein
MDEMRLIPGVNQRIVGFWIDIDDRRQMQENLQDASSSSPPWSVKPSMPSS